MGLAAGGERETRLDPQDAFGERDPEAIIEVERSEFPDDVAAGDEFEAEHLEENAAIPLRVVEVRDDAVVVDTNHPLAGQRIILKWRVLSVRPATEQELEEAVARLSDPAPVEGPLLPVERLLRRGQSDAVKSDSDPPPHPPRVA